MAWPNNADGDIFRMLESINFNFSLIYEIDFNVDFDHWPLASEDQQYIFSFYPKAEIIDPDEEDIEEGVEVGYVLIKLDNKVQYEFVIDTQKRITEQMSIIGGVCESWGVFHGQYA